MKIVQIEKVDQIESLILTVRGQRVMLDFNLARIYGVELKRLNQQVQRNLERFPKDFAFQLTLQEFANLISQFAISSWIVLRGLIERENHLENGRDYV